MKSRLRAVRPIVLLLAACHLAGPPGAAAEPGWISLGPFLEQSAGEIEIDAAGASTLYAIHGAGVLRSRNRGATWHLGDEGLSGEDNLHHLRADPHQPGGLFVWVNTVGVYRSSDGGKHWRPAANRGLSALARGNPTDLLIHPDRTSTLYLGTLDDWVLVSEDGGDSWHPAGADPGISTRHAIHALAFDPDHPATLYAAASGIDHIGPGASPAAFKSTDGGATWRQLEIAPALQGFDLPIPIEVVVPPGGSGTIYLGSYDAGVIRSDDGGATWARASDGLPEGEFGTTVHVLAADPAAPSTLYAGTERLGESADGVYRTMDRGGHWEPAGAGLPADDPIRDLAIAPRDPGTVLAAPGPYLLSASGDRWRSLRPLLPAPVRFVTPHPADERSLFLGGPSPGLRRSRDGGATWEPLGAARFPSAEGLVVDPTSPDTLYLLGPFLFQSEDGGRTWSSRNDALPSGASELVVDRRDSADLYAIGFGRLSRSSDGGESWTRLEAPGALASSLALTVTGPPVLLVGTGVTGEPGDPEGICRSTDGGESWTCPATGLPEGVVTSIAVVPDDPARAYLAFEGVDGSSRVLRSVDGGRSWSPASLGLPGAVLLDLAVDPEAPDTVWAATYGRGTYRSTDGGASWLPASSGLGPVLVEDLTFGPGGLYAATRRGVFRLDESSEAGDPPPPADVPWLEDAGIPGFRLKVRIAQGAGQTIPGTKEPACIPETVCVSGALPGRSELFVRIVGPKPNGWLWPTLVKFSTSRVEVWLQQLSTGELRYYELRGASPGFDELPGLFDRFGFLPG